MRPPSRRSPSPPTMSSANKRLLKRNQACRECRRRKQKCDAAKPHCGSCVRHWRARVSVPCPPGYTHPPEPICTYDPIEGLILSPDQVADPNQRARLLEDKIAELQVQLLEAQDRHNKELLPPTRGGSRSHSASSTSDGSHSNLSSHGHTALPHGASLPDNNTLFHLVDLYFQYDPCGSRMLHPPTLSANLALSTKHPNYPHPALLHAISASAARWMPAEQGWDQQHQSRFAEYHASCARAHIEEMNATGRMNFQIHVASIIIAWWLYHQGRWSDAWSLVGSITRTSLGFGLNSPGTHPSRPESAPYFSPAKDNTDLEMRRRVMWMSVILDRVISVGQWAHSMGEEIIGTEFPLCNVDYDRQNAITKNPQSLSTGSALTTHIPGYTDSFILVVKASLLLGRVTDYNVRRGLHRSSKERHPGAERAHRDFRAIDQLLTDFLLTLPSSMRTCPTPRISSSGGLKLDVDLYLVHLIPHAATITLHNPLADFYDANCVSVRRLLQAAQSIVVAHNMLHTARFDLKRLHPFVTICWYLAGAVLVRLKEKLEKDRMNTSSIARDIDLLRQAMVTYGAASPIGVTQEKLLCDSMQCT
ncbi:hypothetical protein BOTBODRAFT_69421 [Botryobasidium botryosum FD-172 SS1]|uniref:Zn(2)-C6 fungal-type domain-containing protein n=1 Tax=Botryobasidium botryosum (strain FD-172 SS1) TaxID=930990 RepID=A0A067MAZ0_BOTB1|nr:hypothetical protein BOTBODRAFT_69421 [Botryobasidium botryosum FD-172 SS1]